MSAPYVPARLNLTKFKTCRKPYKKGNLANFANLTNVVSASVRRRVSNAPHAKEDFEEKTFEQKVTEVTK